MAALAKAISWLASMPGVLIRTCMVRRTFEEGGMLLPIVIAAREPSREKADDEGAGAAGADRQPDGGSRAHCRDCGWARRRGRRFLPRQAGQADRRLWAGRRLRRLCPA